jgi:DNA polymerase elongation subunit (family B)
MHNREDFSDDISLIEKLRSELEELNDVFNNWVYYDVDGLFFTIREKQSKLKSLELSVKASQLNKL